MRLDNPIAISRESTSTPKPVWEDAEGNQLTLKKVWADANGKEIDDEEYQARQRLMKEREEVAKDAPQSGCCSSKQPKSEPDSPKGGCRHLQSMAATQPHPGPSILDPTPQSQTAKPTPEPWMSTCSCGTGCSCLYCPDHPNNATSINHAQQQVRNLAEQAYTGGNTLTPVPSNTESTSRSCMGGQPSFFLSNTPDVSQHNLQQFFADTLNPNAIYLAYPISQHSWTNRPLSSHCSHVPSPPNVMAMSPDSHDPYADPLTDMSTPLHLPNDVNGTWNFSDGQLGGGTSFSWTGMDASYGTDYSIGQATVASISNVPMPLMHVPPIHQTSAMRVGMTPAVINTPLSIFPDLPQLIQDPFIDFDMTNPDTNVQADLFGTDTLPTFNVQPPQRSCCAPSYDDFDLIHETQVDSDFDIGGISRTNSPIMNRV